MHDEKHVSVYILFNTKFVVYKFIYFRYALQYKLYVNKTDIMAFVWGLGCFCFSCKMVKMQIRGFYLNVTICGNIVQMHLINVVKSGILLYVTCYIAITIRIHGS